MARGMRSRLRWRTIRQRGRRKDAGQVSAIATTFTLLLIVSYIANYLATTLPGQMENLEFQHQLLVEDQLLRLQSAVQAEVNSRIQPVTVPSPITLGSLSEPPFGGAAQGSLVAEPATANQTVNYQLDSVTPNPPNWGKYSGCLPGGAGHCAGNGNVNYANLSGNNTTLVVDITGGNNSLVYNINGNNDSLTVTWSGKDENIVAVVINGSYDTVNFKKSGSDTTVPTMNFYFFGSHETFKMSMAGSHSSKGGMNVGVKFIGSLNISCPYDNLSSTDKVGTLGAGGSNLNMTVTWWNAVGYVTDPNVTPYPGGTLPSEAITWQNVTGFASCPFLNIYSSKYSATYFGGLTVNLANRYIPTTAFGYEFGAVMEAYPSGPAFMVSPPAFSFQQTRGGLNATLQFIELKGSLPSVSGVATAVVMTRVISVASVNYGSGLEGLFVATPYFLNISTQYPAAWVSYFDSFPDAFPYGVTCKVVGASLGSGYTCLTPPAGRSVLIIAPLYVQNVDVTTVTVAVTAT